MTIPCPHCSAQIEIDEPTLASLQDHPHFSCPSCQGLVEVPSLSGHHPVAPLRAAVHSTTPRPTATKSTRSSAATGYKTHRGINRNLLILGSVTLLVLGGLGFFLASRGGNIINNEQKITKQIINNSYFQNLIATGAATKKDLEGIEIIRPYADGFIGISREPLDWDKSVDLAELTGAKVLEPNDGGTRATAELTHWLEKSLAEELAIPAWVQEAGQARILDGAEMHSVSDIGRLRRVLLHWSTSQIKPKKAKILFFSKSSGFEHSVISWKSGKPSHAEKVFLDLGSKNSWDFEFSKDGSKFTPGYLAGFDAVIFYTSGDLTTAGTDGQPPMTPAGKQALFDYVKSGKGFIGIHSASDTFHSDKELQKGPERFVNHGKDADSYIKFLGGEFIIHGDQQIATNRVIDPEFPGFENVGLEFSFQEEWYSLKDFSPDIHVLTVMETSPMKGDSYQRPPFPSSWARAEGKGRVFYTSVGHREDVWTNPVFQQILVGGVKWALGEAPGSVAPNITDAAPGAYTNPPSAQPALTRDEGWTFVNWGETAVDLDKALILTKDDVLMCSKEKQACYLMTNRTFKTMLFTIEFRHPRGEQGHGGAIVVGSPGPRDIKSENWELRIPLGFEFKLGSGVCGQLELPRTDYQVELPLGQSRNGRRVTRSQQKDPIAGEWNKLEIECTDDQNVVFKLNGEIINEVAKAENVAGKIVLWPFDEVHFRNPTVIVNGRTEKLGFHVTTTIKK